jgi:hypothetical protein
LLPGLLQGVDNLLGLKVSVAGTLEADRPEKMKDLAPKVGRNKPLVSVRVHGVDSPLLDHQAICSVVCFAMFMYLP